MAAELAAEMEKRGKETAEREVNTILSTTREALQRTEEELALARHRCAESAEGIRSARAAAERADRQRVRVDALSQSVASAQAVAEGRNVELEKEVLQLRAASAELMSQVASTHPLAYPSFHPTTHSSRFPNHLFQRHHLEIHPTPPLTAPSTPPATPVSTALCFPQVLQPLLLLLSRSSLTAPQVIPPQGNPPVSIAGGRKHSA